jgi:acetyl esterase/lipase
MNKSYISYLDETPSPASMLMKGISEKNALAMRSLTVAEQREIKTRLSDLRPSSILMTSEETMCAGVPCEWVCLKNGCRNDKVILYIHGGGWIFGNLKTARAYAMYASECFGCKMLVVDYGLAPERPYPGGLDDCFSVYLWLLANGYKARDIALLGDSAGGNLGLCLMNKLKVLGYEQPACMAAASPATDLRPQSALVQSKIDLTYTVLDGAEQDIFSIYARESDRDDPMISPIVADLSDIAPVLIHVGEDEPLTADNIAFADKARMQGAEVSVRVYKDMFHDFSIVGRTLKESRQSVAEFKEFFETHLFQNAVNQAAPLKQSTFA